MNRGFLNIDDDTGQSVLDQQEQRTIWQEEEQLCNNQEEIVGEGESVENSDDDGVTNWRCSYQNEEENIKDSSFNNNSDMAG